MGESSPCQRPGWTALSALINKLMIRLKSEILSSFQFVDLASIAFALVIPNSC
ncbi:hypothetical protein LEP1GSC193_1418 [Leptospira alstonii serovar Pingchang str. 80-412]|uniref:Uncharacterized protein n=2 Tax=Leptospira alstonii TaxID=28452 RepID=M6CIE4_9LEPT|nr:hypothetical protein LEP1GSC194_0612 [Leptospira alstonii serovar Sichuan str. 79601]EQA81789.1 hypothetical protein LEP1GSC193_1418 [Leptospira alstonii serovar Pingchang str. 80-412]